MTLIPAHDFVGARNVTITATDDSLCSISINAQIQINDVNEAPVMNFPNLISGTEDTPLNISLDQYVSDIDNDFTELLVSASNGAHCQSQIVNNTLTLTPVTNYNGYDSIIITASDQINQQNKNGIKSLSRLATIDTIRVKFVSVNDLPVITNFSPDSLTITVEQNTPVVFSVSASDVDNAALFYYWFVNNINQSNSSSTLTKTFLNTGNYVIKCKITDTYSSIYQNWNVSVIAAESDLTVKADRLYRNYPNPFNPETRINFDLKKEGRVELRIYNNKGQLVRNLLSENRKQGKHSVIWNGKDNNDRSCSSGIYFYELKSRDFKSTQKMLLMK
jgi:hypothetical protein